MSFFFNNKRWVLNPQHICGETSSGEELARGFDNYIPVYLRLLKFLSGNILQISELFHVCEVLI